MGTQAAGPPCRGGASCPGPPLHHSKVILSAPWAYPSATPSPWTPQAGAPSLPGADPQPTDPSPGPGGQAGIAQPSALSAELG